MSADTTHKLAGLEPDNLLAFMALLGLLRALETAEPEWRPRACWDDTRHPLRPVLTLAQAKTQEDIAGAARRGVEAWSQSLAVLVARAREIDNARGEKLRSEDSQLELTRDVETLRELIQNEATLGLFLSGLAVLGIGKSGDLEANTTPLMFPSGQMAFVGTLVSLSRSPRTGEIASALFERWTYEHKGETLRFDPSEARRYALQGKDPAPQGAWSERGASCLAVLAFPSYPVFPAARQVQIPGARWIGRQMSISWPLWRGKAGRGATLAAIEALLRTTGDVKSWRSLTANGVFAVARTARIRISDQGNYFNVAAAQIAQLPFPSE